MTHLMQPRYKVIADYPVSQLRIGDILVDEQKDYELWRNNRDLITWQFSPAQYPKIFRRLEWWEDRRPEEMPQYVKYRFMPESEEMVFRVEKHFTSSIGDMNPYGYIPNGDYGFCSYSKSIPATLEEYTAYQTRHV